MEFIRDRENIFVHIPEVRHKEKYTKVSNKKYGMDWENRERYVEIIKADHLRKEKYNKVESRQYLALSPPLLCQPEKPSPCYCKDKIQL